MDVVFILDVSGSIDEVQRYGMMVEMARMIVAGLPVASGQARVGAITFDNVAKNQFYLTTYDRNLEALLTAFEFNHARAATNTQAALNLARTDQVCGSTGVEVFYLTLRRPLLPCAWYSCETSYATLPHILAL